MRNIHVCIYTIHTYVYKKIYKKILNYMEKLLYRMLIYLWRSLGRSILEKSKTKVSVKTVYVEWSDKLYIWYFYITYNFCTRFKIESLQNVPYKCIIYV